MNYILLLAGFFTYVLFVILYYVYFKKALKIKNHFSVNISDYLSLEDEQQDHLIDNYYYDTKDKFLKEHNLI